MNQQELRAAVDTFVEENCRRIVADIKRVVDIPSVEGTPEPGKPFGPGPAVALDEALAIAREMGLSTGSFDGCMGWAELPGQTQGQVAVIGHMDVVPAGNGWDGDPFCMREQDGWLIGRGVVDDKGPCVLALYALKFLKERQIPLRYGVRVLLGTNEETGMKDVERYLAAFPAPDFCFSPDADFPVCNGEKGTFSAKLVSPAFSQGTILDFQGGVAENVVPDRAECVVRCQDLPEMTMPGITVEQEGQTLRIRARGKGGHASTPKGTVNAIGLVVDYLLAAGLASEEERPYLRFLQKLHSNTDGSGVGIAAQDEVFTPLTIIGGTIQMRQGRLYQSVDSRYPTSITAKEIAQRLESAAEGSAQLQELFSRVPFYISADSAPVQVLMEAYNSVTGQKAQAFTMGGGTYARHFPKAVSFGPEYPGAVLPDFVGPIHGANEGASLEGLLQALKIYILALAGLQEVELGG